MTPRTESLALLAYLACLFWVRSSSTYDKNVSLFWSNHPNSDIYQSFGVISVLQNNVNNLGGKSLCDLDEFNKLMPWGKYSFKICAVEYSPMGFD